MKKLFLFTILISIFSFLPMFVLANGGDEHMGESMMGMMGWNSLGMGIGGGWFGLVFMVLFWGLIIWLVVVLIQRLTDQGKSREDRNSALDILKERYAKGEINKQEFEEKKKDLS